MNDFQSQAENLEIDSQQDQLTSNNQNLIFWGINATSIDVNWDMPTLEYVAKQNNSLPPDYSIIQLPNGNQVSSTLLLDQILLNSPADPSDCSGSTGSSKSIPQAESPSRTQCTSTATTSLY